MNEEYLIGLFRKSIIEAKADVMTELGRAVLRGAHPELLQELAQQVERSEVLLRDEKALRSIARSVLVSK